MLTIDLKDALLCLLIVAAIVLVIYGIVAVYRLGKSMIKLDKILTDFEVVSETASKRTKQLDENIDRLSKSLSGMAKRAKDGHEIFSVISTVVKTISSVVSVFKKDAEKDK